MNLFGYIWVVVLILVYIIWTIKCIKDFINDVHSPWKLSFLFNNGASWGWWIAVHLVFIVVSSFMYFIYFLFLR